MIITKDSHLDHGLTAEQITYLLKQFADVHAFRIAAVTLPTELGQVTCALYGPVMGDPPQTDVRMGHRGERAWESRLVALPPRPTSTVTVIMGPHEGYPCVLYTAFGGPLAPREPGDPSCDDSPVSLAFWSTHALSVVP